MTTIIAYKKSQRFLKARLTGKILHFSNAKILDLDEEEAQYFLDITGAKGISGYGNASNGLSSAQLDSAFFSLFKEDDNIFDIVEELHQRHYALSVNCLILGCIIRVVT